jgi:hypothetical protein
MVFVDKIAKIAAVVSAFINSIVAIAAGNIGAAAGKVESILAGLLSLAINFLAGFAGLGKVAGKIMGIVNKVRDKVDKALDMAIAWIVAKAKALFAKLFGKKDKDKKKDDRNDVKTKVKNELAGRLAGEVEAGGVPAIISDVRGKFQKDGLKSLKATEKEAGDFELEATASPGSKVGHFTVRDFEIKRARLRPPCAARELAGCPASCPGNSLPRACHPDCANDQSPRVDTGEQSRGDNRSDPREQVV